MSTAIVIVAAGSGTRLGAAVPKAFVAVGGRTLLAHAVARALEVPDVVRVVVVAPGSHLDEALAEVGADARVTVVAGGAHRTASVAAGLAAVGEAADVVLVHDAARAFTPADVFTRVAAAVTAGADAVVPGVAVVDTIKLVDDDGLVVATPDRAALRAVQTPQGFDRRALVAAHASGVEATDDAALVEALGRPVLVVPGDARAFKVTTPEDLDRAERLVATGVIS